MTAGSGDGAVGAFMEALRERDWARLADVLHDELSWTLMSYELPGPATMDRATALRMLPELLAVFDEGSPRMALGRMIIQGDCMAVECEGSGSFRNGTPYRNRYAIIFEVVDQRIRTMREYMDTGHMASMLAAAQEPAGPATERRSS
jgi:ketosteroid isomerase-like protein